MNKLLKILFSAWCIAVVFSSCVKEEYENNAGHLKPGGDTEVVMRLKSPGKFAAGTRGMTVTQENNIDDIRVLVFDKNSKLTDVKSGSNISDAGSNPVSNERSFSVTLAASRATEDTKLVVLANASHISFDAEGHIGSDYSTVMSGFTSSISGAMFRNDNPVIPMWGETVYITISPSNNVFPLKLHRAIARIDVGLGTPVFNNTTGEYIWSNDLTLPFELHEVFLFKPNDAYSVVPATGNFGPDKAHTPSPVGSKFSIADSQTKFRFSGTDIVDGCYTSQSIYVPEADVVMDGSGKSGDTNHKERLAVIVGGKYNNSATVTYYRLDFQSRGNLMNVLRNHLYQFNVKAVSGAGHANPEDAYNSLAMNMSAEIVEWNDGEMDDVNFDGQYYFGIEKREVVFSPMGDETVVLKVRTNVPDWAMWELDNAALNDVLHATNSPTYRNETYGYDYEIKRTSSDAYTLTLKSEKHNVSNNSDPRKERFKIKAKRLEMDFTVEQQYTTLYVSIVNGQSKRILPEGTTPENSINIEIMSLKPVAVTRGTSDWIDLGSYPNLSTPQNGLYTARMNVTVAPFNVNTDGTLDRTGLISITPQGETPIIFRVDQEKPYILLSKTKEYIPRTASTYSQLVDVVTNVRTEDLSLALFAGYSLPNTDDRITLARDLYNTDPLRPRFLKFEVAANMGGTLPVDAYGAQFDVSATSALYGSLKASAEFIVESSLTIFHWYWMDTNFAHDNYVFPWNVTTIGLDFFSNKGLTWDENRVGARNPADVMIQTGIAQGDGSLKYPVQLTVDNPNYNTPDTYRTSFVNTDNANYTITFKQGIQYFSRTDFANSAIFDWNGVAQASNTKVDITANVQWQAAIATNPTWTRIKVGTGSWGAATGVVDDRLSEPVSHTGSYPTPAILTKVTPLYLNVDVLTVTDINTADRSATLSFTNSSYDATKLGAAAPADIVLTQRTPKLAHTSNTIANPIPAAGASYTVAVSTNLQGWGVRVYSGSNLLVQKAFGASPVISSIAAAVASSTEVAVPANASTTADRALSFRLYCSEFPTHEDEFKTVTQNKKTEDGGSGDILYFDGNNRLKVGKYNQGATLTNMAYFKFGSVVGFTHNSAAWSAAAVKFNPSGSSTAYESIPSFTATDYNAGLTAEGVISTVAYHNAENVKKNGKGDPCKLVGLTAAEIAAMTDDALNNYKSGWRLPTSRENVDFIAAPTSYYTSSASIGHSSMPFWSNGGWFPVLGNREQLKTGRSRNTNPDGFLPAAGDRSTFGAPEAFGINGNYWSSTPSDASYGHCLFFASLNVRPRYSQRYATGVSVRCVPQD